MKLQAVARQNEAVTHGFQIKEVQEAGLAQEDDRRSRTGHNYLGVDSGVLQPHNGQFPTEKLHPGSNLR